MKVSEFAAAHNLSGTPKHALTVRQPHAHLLATGFKTIESRSWPIPKKIAPMEPIAIHAASKVAADDATLDYMERVWEQCPKAFDAVDAFHGVNFEGQNPDVDSDDGPILMPTSAIIGVVWFRRCLKDNRYGDVDSVRDGEEMPSIDHVDKPCGIGPSPETPFRLWAGGSGYMWEAAHAVRLETVIPIKGRLNVWGIPGGVPDAIASATIQEDITRNPLIPQVESTVIA